MTRPSRSPARGSWSAPLAAALLTACASAPSTDDGAAERPAVRVERVALPTAGRERPSPVATAPTEEAAQPERPPLGIVGDGPVLAVPELDDAQRRQLQAAVNRSRQHLGARRADEAAAAAREGLELSPEHSELLHHLALAELLRGDEEAARRAFERAWIAGYRFRLGPPKGTFAEIHAETPIEEWFARKASVDVPPPRFLPESLAGTQEELARRKRATEEVLETANKVLGLVGRAKAQWELAHWEAASWEALAAQRQGQAATWARVNALKAISQRQAWWLRGSSVRDVLRRSTELLEEATSPQLVAAILACEAEAHVARSIGQEDEEEARAAREAAVAALDAAAKGVTGRTKENLLVRRLSLGPRDRADAAAVWSELLADGADPERVGERLEKEALAAHFLIEGLPEFRGTTTAGELVDRASLLGAVTLIDFWATWCGPCKEELPNLVEVHQEFSGRGLHVVGVAMERSKTTAEHLDAWCAERGVTWPQVYDGKHWDTAMAQQLGVRSIPFALLVDRQGTVVAAGRELRGGALRRNVVAALGAGS